MWLVLLRSGMSSAAIVLLGVLIAGTIAAGDSQASGPNPAVASQSAGSNSMNAEALRESSRCGSYCLYLALKAFDKAPDSLATLELLLGEPGPRGYSMAQLQRTAESYGLKALAVSTSLEALAARKPPFTCIAHLNGRHFALIADIQPHEVRLIDPPAAPSIPTPTFLAQWNGECLLLSDVALESEVNVAQRLRNKRILFAVGKVSAVIAAAVVVVITAVAWRRRMIHRPQLPGDSAT